jgi:hypothetical protein
MIKEFIKCSVCGSETPNGPFGTIGDTWFCSVECFGILENEKDVQAANETQVGGNHYKDQTIQPWDYIISNKLGFLEGNIVKYVSRWRNKGGVEDLKKAEHYLKKLIETEEKC